MKKVLITGVTGFAGSFLVEHILATADMEVSGTYLNESGLDNISSVKDSLFLHKVDLQDANATGKIIAKIKPDLIYHLAALASAAESFKNPAQYISNNISAQVNVFEGVRKAEISPRILVVSSAEVYGNVTQKDLPIDERTELRPVNPYAVSKVAQDFLGLQYFLSYKLPIMRVRPFNHIGPRQSPSFAIASFAQKIAKIEKGYIEPVLRVGNLTAKRDFTDVRDIVRAYKLIAEEGKSGDVYNLGLGRSYLVADILDKLLSLSQKEIKVETDPELLRPVDVPELVCDNSKIKNELAWDPAIDIDQTLKDTLEYWRNTI